MSSAAAKTRASPHSTHRRLSHRRLPRRWRRLRRRRPSRRRPRRRRPRRRAQSSSERQISICVEAADFAKALRAAHAALALSSIQVTLTLTL